MQYSKKNIELLDETKKRLKKNNMRYNTPLYVKLKVNGTLLLIVQKTYY